MFVNAFFHLVSSLVAFPIEKVLGMGKKYSNHLSKYLDCYLRMHQLLT